MSQIKINQESHQVSKPSNFTVKFTTFTNTLKNLNKEFSLDKDGKVIKKSNAQMSIGTAKVINLNSLREFDTYLNNLQSNQAIGLGVPIEDIREANICIKGKEDLSTNTISRSKEYQQWSDGFALCLFDYDPDDAMSDAMKINSADQFRSMILRMIPELMNTDMIIRPGSSYGVKKEDGECVSCKQSYHMYFIVKLNGNNDMNNFVEYCKRKAVETELCYLKIFVDAKSQFRTPIDLSVLKSAQSRLIFEASPTCKDGLYQDRGDTKYYHENSGNYFDITNLNLKLLPSWENVQENLRLKHRDDIAKIKQEYKNKQIKKLLEKGLSKQKADMAFSKLYEDNMIASSETIKLDNNISMTVFEYIQKYNGMNYISDIYEPQKGNSKAIINTKNIFDATIYTYIRGGQRYSISYTVTDIKTILKRISKDELKFDMEKILYTLIKYCITTDISLKDIKELNKYIKTISEFDDFEKRYKTEVIKYKSMKLLENHAVLAFGGKVGIIDTSKVVLEDYSESAMKTLFKNKKILGKNPVDIWLEDPKRKEYLNVVFAPNGDVQPYEYNVFKGFAYNPVQNDRLLEPFYELVLNTICNGDQFMYGLVWSWMADIIQNPASKKGTALVLRGQKGAGKGTFATIFGRLLKDYFLETSNTKRIFGEFNAHLANNLVVYLNEAIWSGDKSNEGKLKNLITDIDFTYEIKQGAVFSGYNYSHLIIDSNEDHIVSDGPDERRFINLDVSSNKIGNHEYFENLYKLSAKKEFLEALMYSLSTFDYSSYKQYLRRAPKTAMSKEQLLYSLEPIEEWWLTCLQEGNIIGSKDPVMLVRDDMDSFRITNLDMYNSFTGYIRSKGQKVHMSQIAFGQKLYNKVLSPHLSKDTKIDNKRTAKKIASLVECKKDFCNKFRIDRIDSQITTWNFTIQDLTLGRK